MPCGVRPSVGYSGLKHEGDPEETQRQQLVCVSVTPDCQMTWDGRTDLDGHCRRPPPSRPNLISKFSAVADITHRHLPPSRDEMATAAAARNRLQTKTRGRRIAK